MLSIIMADTKLILLATLFVLSAAYLLFRLFQGRSRDIFVSTPILSSFSKDMTEMARQGRLDPVVGREKEIRHLIMVLSKRTKNNAVLIGEAGVGKTTIAEGLAERIVAGNVPFDLLKKRVLALDLNSLLAGTKYRGEFEQRIKHLTDEITRSDRNIIIFIDEIHNLIEAESSGESISVGDIFKPAMARGDLQIVGATTQEEYESYFQKDLAFKRRLQPIFVNEPDKEETFAILKGIRKKYEDYHRVKISDEVLRSCIDFSEKMLPGRSFPDKAIDLMDEACSQARIECLNDDSSDCQVLPEAKISDVERIAAEYREVAN